MKITNMTLYCFYFYDINNIFVFSDRIFRACEPNLWNSIRVLHKHIMSRYAGTRTQVIYSTLYTQIIPLENLNPNFNTLRSLKIFILALKINTINLDWLLKTCFLETRWKVFCTYDTDMLGPRPRFGSACFSTFKCLTWDYYFYY